LSRGDGFAKVAGMRSTRSENTAGSRRRRTALEMEAVLERYWGSGQTQRVFTEKEGIGVSTLQYWLRRMRGQGAQGSRRRKWSGQSGGASASAPLSLLEVELVGAGRKTSQAAYEIELPDGTHLRLSSGFAEGEVRRLLALLREVR